MAKMNGLRHPELLAGRSSFDLRSLPNSHCSWCMTSWDGRRAGGCRPTMSGQRQRKAEWNKGKAWRLTDRALWFVSLAGWQNCVECNREGKDKWSRAQQRRGGENRWQTRGTRLAEELRMAEPSFIHFPSANKPCFFSVTVQPQTAHQLFILVMAKAPFWFHEGIQQIGGSVHRSQTL